MTANNFQTLSERSQFAQVYAHFPGPTESSDWSAERSKGLISLHQLVIPLLRHPSSSAAPWLASLRPLLWLHHGSPPSAWASSLHSPTPHWPVLTELPLTLLCLLSSLLEWASQVSWPGTMCIRQITALPSGSVYGPERSAVWSQS